MKIAVQSKNCELAFECGTGETILQAGLRQGLTLPYECATGTCGTCRARVISGDVDIGWQDAPGLARLKKEKGDVLMCQTRPHTDCLVRVPSTSARNPVTYRPDAKASSGLCAGLPRTSFSLSSRYPRP